MQRQRVVLFGIVASVALLIAGCSDMGRELVGTTQTPLPPPPPPAGDVSFKNQITPIFQAYGCYGCHAGSGGLYVQTVAQLLRGGDHGPAIVPGNSNASSLIKKLSPTPPFGDRMPQGGPYLPDSTIQLIGLWVNQGAKDN